VNLRSIFGRFCSDLLDWAIDRAIALISSGALRYVPALLLIALAALLLWRLS
jgi:hypothetical protein